MREPVTMNTVGSDPELKTMHHLEPGVMFRDEWALWLVCDGGDSDNIHATRIGSPNVNNTGELMFSRDYATIKMRVENYNAYNQVQLIDGIYHVVKHRRRPVI